MERGSVVDAQDDLFESLVAGISGTEIFMTGKGGVRNYIKLLNNTEILTWRMIWVFFHTGGSIPDNHPPRNNV